MELDVKDLLKGISDLFDRNKKTTKYFKTDGSPAMELEASREDLIHESEIKTAFDTLKKNNNDNIEQINDPAKVTKTKGAYGLTDQDRRWLLEYIFAVEGGYFNHPNDPGGETMYGIIKSVARQYGYNGPMKSLPKEVAVEIYLKKYWTGLDQIKDFRVAMCIFDFVVNSGNRGIQVAQATVNKVVAVKGKMSVTKEKYKNLTTLQVDGKMGPKTIAAINSIDPQTFIRIYFTLQEDKYEDLMRANPKLRSFDEGWENRTAVKALFLTEYEKFNNLS